MASVRGKTLFICLCVVAFLVSIRVNAIESSIWINPNVGTKSLFQNNVNEYVGDKFCNTHTEYEIEYSTLLGSRKFLKLNPVDACWYTTSYGLIGYNAPYSRVYVKVSNQSNSVVRLTDNTYGMSLGKTNAMAYTYYMNSYSRMLYIYENITSRLSLSKNGSFDQYTLDRSTSPWKLQYADGSLVGVNKIFSSQNGEWLVVEGGSGFIRINVKTKEVLTFESAIYGYGYGSDPTHELAISDDGRYAIVGGGPLNTKITYIYDLSSCFPNANKYQPATGCGKRNFKADYFGEMAVNRAPSNFLFSTDNESIITNVLNNLGTTDKYIVTAPGKSEHLMEYIALGDSYSSGEGEYDGKHSYLGGTDGDGAELPEWQTLLPDFPYEIEKCHLSNRSYPYLLANTANLGGMQFVSTACSGSTMLDVTGSISGGLYDGKFKQFKNYSNTEEIVKDIQKKAINLHVPGRSSQIEFITKYKPKTVTIGIGGNDINFSAKVKECLNAGTCSSATTLKHYTGLEIYNLHKKLMDTYKRLGEAGPTTRFYVVGYPQIISNDDTCALNVGLNFEERILARNIISYLNQVIKSAAESAGFTYLDIENSLAGEQLCDESYDGKAVQGIVGGNDIGFQLPNKTTVNFIGNESFHPTHIGHAMIANAISAQLNNQSIIEYRKCVLINGLRCPSGNNSPPPIPTYFTSENTNNSEYVVNAKSFDSIYEINDQPGVQQGATVPLKQPLTDSREVLRLAPTQTASVTMYSSPQNVGTMTVDINGNASGAITIPAGAEAGYHTIVINIKDSLYRNVTLYQQIFVYDTLEDFDGDGIANADEKCGMVNPANVDEDRDGIDDACDGIISAAPDTTAPTITAHLSSEPNQNGWYKDDVTVSWTVSDDVDTDLVAPADLIANKEGENTYESGEVCDKAGNCAKGSISIKLDKTKPIVNAGTTNTSNQNGWLNSDTIINWSASDNLSIASNPQSTLANLEGEHTYNSDEVCDDAGNCTSGLITVKIDKTAPVVASIAFTKNPKAVSERSELSSNVVESESSITEAEYFIGDDLGLGSGATMNVNGNTMSTKFGTDFGTGVYKISIRAKDAADNWSNVESDYLVVYDATSGVRLRGSRMVELNSGSNQLPWVGGSNSMQGKFAFSVRYGGDGKVTPQSDFQFAYKVGTNCMKLPHNCHSFELNATSIKWLTTTGSNQEVGIFNGVGTLKSDDQSQPVAFTVYAQDGERLSPLANDTFSVSLYPESGSFGTSSLYFVAPTEVGRGNIKIRF